MPCCHKSAVTPNGYIIGCACGVQEGEGAVDPSPPPPGGTLRYLLAIGDRIWCGGGEGGMRRAMRHGPQHWNYSSSGRGGEEGGRVGCMSL